MPNKKKDPKRVNQEHQTRLKSFPFSIIVSLIGAVFILIFGPLVDPARPDHWMQALVHLGQALIIAGVISLLIDLPAMARHFRKITIESLVSKEYIETLSREELLNLRKKCTEKIHLKGSQFVEQGLLEMDERVCDLLTKHYHERYRQNVSCKLDGEFVIKKQHVEEFIINPLQIAGSTCKFPENVKHFVYSKNEEEAQKFFKIIKYTVSADEKPEVDYVKDGIKLKVIPCNTTDMPYNTEISIVNKDNNPLEFEFDKSLRIEKIWEIRVPKADITFLKRVKIPVKSFRLDYHFPDSGVKLVAACFGTLAFSAEGNIKIIHEEDHISVESYTWMLPGNGVYVVAVN